MKRTRRRLSVEDLADAEHFHAAGLLLMSKCAVCGKPSTEVHHVIDAQKLRSMNASIRKLLGPKAVLINVYDLDNGLGLCELCHVRHTRAIVRVPRRYLRPANLAFAREHHVSWWIDRFYPDDRPIPRSRGLVL